MLFRSRSAELDAQIAARSHNFRAEHDVIRLAVVVVVDRDLVAVGGRVRVARVAVDREDQRLLAVDRGGSDTDVGDVNAVARFGIDSGRV